MCIHTDPSSIPPQYHFTLHSAMSNAGPIHPFLATGIPLGPDNTSYDGQIVGPAPGMRCPDLSRRATWIASEMGAHRFSIQEFFAQTVSIWVVFGSQVKVLLVAVDEDLTMLQEDIGDHLRVPYPEPPLYSERDSTLPTLKLHIAASDSMAGWASTTIGMNSDNLHAMLRMIQLRGGVDCIEVEIPGSR